MERTPIASGSIAQVHRAKLRQDWMPPSASPLENEPQDEEQSDDVTEDEGDDDQGRSHGKNKKKMPTSLSSSFSSSLSSAPGGVGELFHSLFHPETSRWAAAAEWVLTRGGWRTAAAARAGSVVAVKVRHPAGPFHFFYKFFDYCFNVSHECVLCEEPDKQM